MKTTRINAAFIAALLGSVFLVALAAEPPPASWPQFRGPNTSGVAPNDARPPIHFGPETNLLWKTAVPPGRSAPVVWGACLLLTGLAGNQ